MDTTRRHFHTFDALRFFSFLLVFLQHVSFSDTLSFFFSHSGGIGVSFFFVLSGFLITYILLQEKMATGQIALKKFFMRRILRIWPLFYAMILFAFLTPGLLSYFNLHYTNEGYHPNWVLSVLFLENYKMMFTHSFPDISPLRVMWSLCVEEHFYVFWGLLIYFIAPRKVPVLILGSIALATIARVVYHHFGIAEIDLFTNIDYFAFGAIPAYFLVFKPGIIQDKIAPIPLYLKYGFVFITITLVFCIPNLRNEIIHFLEPLVFGLLFSGVIIFTLSQNNAIHISDDYWISKLGVYTYGLYLFHTIIINFLLAVKGQFPFEIHGLVFAIIALGFTIGVSAISYHLFEKQFLKLKVFFY